MSGTLWLARRLQGIYRRVVRHGFGIYRTAAEGRERTVDTRRGKVRVLEYGFDVTETQPLFVDLHGGGFVLGSADMDETICLALQALGMKGISIDYPKAPDHPYPAAVEAIHDVIAWYVSQASELGIDTERMAIGGHSAGGDLATVTCMNDLAEREFRFKCQVLDYPVTDCATPPTEKPHPKGALPNWMMEMFNACYAPGETARDIQVSPAFAAAEDLAGMPPALLILCGHDSLHDEGLRYAGTLRSAGVDVTVKEYPEQPHGFTGFAPTDDSREAIALMGQFIRSHLQ